MPNDVRDNDTANAVNVANTSSSSEAGEASEAESDNSELAKLIAEAEQTSSVPVTDHPRPCPHVAARAADHDAVDTIKKCPTCLWSFCEACASTLDPTYCKLCLTNASAELQELPLVDQDGVQHNGRVLHPSPEASFFKPRFGTLAKTISEMSAPELEEYIDHYKLLVHQAEKALDFRRVVLGSSQLELSQRKDANRRKLAADKTQYPVHLTSVDKKTGQQKTVKVSTAKLGDMLKALEMIRALRIANAAKPKDGTK